MIYKINNYNSPASYYVADQETLNSVKEINPDLNYIIGTKADAELALKQTQETVLQQESVRFSMCATFLSGNDTIWREAFENDPEYIEYQVFDNSTGKYTMCSNKTEAFALKEQFKQEFLSSCGLDEVVDLTEVPVPTNLV